MMQLTLGDYQPDMRSNKDMKPFEIGLNEPAPRLKIHARRDSTGLDGDET